MLSRIARSNSDLTRLGRALLRVFGTLLIVVAAAVSPAAPAMAVAPAVVPGAVEVSISANTAGAEHRPDVARPPPQAAVAAFAYDTPTELADPAADRARDLRDRPGLGVDRVAPRTTPGASNAADFARLTRQLEFDEAASVFNRSGGLQPSVINNSTPIIRGPQLGNQQVVKALTADGSNIADWAKYTTQSFQSRSGPFQVHFYRNSATGAVNYAYDYKVVFTGR